MTIRQWISENRDNYDNEKELARACMKALKVGRSGVTKVIQDDLRGQRRRTSKGMSLDSFVETHDQDTRARVAIRRVLKELDDLIYSDSDMRQMCGSPTSNTWKMVREEPEFLKYQFELGSTRGGRIFWGKERVVRKAIESISNAKPIE